MTRKVVRRLPADHTKYRHSIEPTNRKRRVRDRPDGEEYDALLFRCTECAREGMSSEMIGTPCRGRDARLYEKRVVW